MRVRFWGVRGSVPWATPGAMRHGCNTPCVEISDERSGATIILDSGSGVVGLGAAIGGAPRELPIVLTHYHWDHLQGLPFLTQLYDPGWTPRIFAPRLHKADAEIINAVFRSPYFPIPYERLPNPPEVELIEEPGEFSLGGFELAAIRLNHPGGAFGYRIRGITGDVVYATDHEFGDPSFDEPLAEFSRGAAALIVDAHFAPDEIRQHRGWGHSDWGTCAEFAASVDAGTLWLFHHKPGRTDEELVRVRADAQRVFRRTETAREGESLSL